MNINEGKETLTFAIIKKDLMNSALIDMALGYAQLPFYLLIAYLLPTFFRYAPFYPIITKLCWITFIVIFLIINISTIPIAIKISKDQFVLKKSTLLQKKENKGPGFSPSLGNDYFAKLLFSHGERFSINRRYTYYKWSRAFSMSKYDLFESSRIDDHFILATVGKKTLMIYNDKFFDTSSIQYSELIY